MPRRAREPVSQAERERPRSRYVSLRDAAIYCDLGERTLRRYVANGELIAYRPRGMGDARFKIEDLDALLGA